MSGKKIAVYTGTRNLYRAMVPAVRSLVANTDVDEVWLLIEDDVFPYKLPAKVQTRNVSDQYYFSHYGPNFHCGWTYMVLMKAALTKEFPDADRILSLDVDTIVTQDIGELFGLDLTGYYMAAVRDTGRNSDDYFNGGVMMMNLDLMRRDLMDDQLILELNVRHFDFCEQEAISELCTGQILPLPAEYNDSDWTGHTENPKIVHFAAKRNWMEEALVRKWMDRDM